MAVGMAPDVPWPVNETQDAVLAAGGEQPAEVQAWQARAARHVQPHAGGHVVFHHWPAQHSGVAPVQGQAPVLLLHGGSGSWTHWVRSLGALTDAGHDVWAVDLPGFGDSDGLPGVSDADGMVHGLAEALAAQFPLQALKLVGFSFGGMTATLLAAAYPHLAQQLVLVGAPGMGLTSKHPVQLKGWRHLAAPREQLAHHVFNLQALMLHDRSKIDRDTVALHVANVRRDRLPRRRISSTDVVVRTLPRVPCPVAAIYGAHDALYPGTLAQVQALMAGAAPHWQGMHCIADAGHWVQYEQPSAFHAALLPVLRQA